MKTDKLSKQLKPYFNIAMRYRALLFFIALSVVYGYVITRINALNNVTPASTGQTSVKRVHLDPTVISRIEKLQDNSVSVQALFDQARQNPFQE